ncbi:MAG: hypothetical protein RLZZ488_768 [Pseudomonadota bacterium]|jgi:hypothetical protein
MTKTWFWTEPLRPFALALAVMTVGGCGVEAGNPDSKGGKPFRIYVSPTSYTNVGAVSAAIDSVSVVQGSKTFEKSYQQQNVILLSSSNPSYEDTFVAFTLDDVVDENLQVQRVEVTLNEKAAYLQLLLGSQSQPVKAVVLNDKGELTRSLVFDGLSKSGSAKDILVDIELRKTLKPVTSEQRLALNLPQDVTFVIQQKHSFLPVDDAGSVAFRDLEADSLVCVFSGVARPEPTADACTGQGYKSQIVSKQGLAVIAALRAGEYQVVNITRDTRVVDLPSTKIEAGKKVEISGK